MTRYWTHVGSRSCLCSSPTIGAPRSGHAQKCIDDWSCEVPILMSSASAEMDGVVLRSPRSSFWRLKPIHLERAYSLLLVVREVGQSHPWRSLAESWFRSSCPARLRVVAHRDPALRVLTLLRVAFTGHSWLRVIRWGPDLFVLIVR